MRLLKIAAYPPILLKKFYARHPTLGEAPYAVQHGALMEACFITSDFWTAALRDYGYQAAEIVCNAEAMQKRWALENDTRYEAGDWLPAVVSAQIENFQPDVLIANYSDLSGPLLRHLRAACPSLRLAVCWCGAPYDDASPFREYDLILSCVPELVDHFRRNGHRSFHLNHAFDPRVLERIDTAAAPTVDFAFLGSIVRHESFHRGREKLLRALIERTALEVWTESGEERRTTTTPSGRGAVRLRRWAFDAVAAARRLGVPQNLLESAPMVRRVARWEARAAKQKPDIPDSLNGRAHPPLFGVEMFQQLHDSKISLNTHIDISPNNASNLRLYEATGVGSCMLTDWKPNITELFEPDVEAVTYRNVDECVEKARYLLENEAERREIAAAGQRRTLRDHTFAQRVVHLDHIIREALRT